LAASLDFVKLRNRKAAVVVTITLERSGCDPLKYNVNTSIRRERMKFRVKIAESLKSVSQPEVRLTIHWDGKMIQDITGHETLDRLTILVQARSTSRSS
jgi:hypothetical protein